MIASSSQNKFETQQIYYRPEWTCGRYNSEHRVAICYNLISGITYFFEDYSAMVIGEILSIPRNGDFNLADISNKLNIAIDSILPFFFAIRAIWYHFVYSTF